MKASPDFALRRLAAGAFRSLPSFKGKTRLIRGVNHLLLRAGLPPEVVSRFDDGTLFRVDLRALTELVPHYLGAYEKKRRDLLLDLCKPGAVVLDVGANVGFFAVPLSARAGRVFCFEPVPANAARLRENLALNGITNAEVTEAALSDSVGVLALSLREDFAGGSATGNAAPWLEDGADTRFKRIEVPMTTLDRWTAETKLARLDLIKVDVEGHEDFFLRGAEKTVERFRPAIVAEFNTDYFRRRGADLDGFAREFLERHRYQAFNSAAWPALAPLQSWWGRANTDDILLLPQEWRKPG